MVWDLLVLVWEGAVVEGVDVVVVWKSRVLELEGCLGVRMRRHHHHGWVGYGS